MQYKIFIEETYLIDKIIMLSVFKNLIDLKKLGVKVIDFTGGEPLLHRELDTFLDEAKRLGFITTLTTNCLLYPKWAKRLKGKVDMLHFSLDSIDKKTHDNGRGVACYDFVMESISVAKTLGERPDILFTVFDENIDEVKRVYDEITRPNNLMLILNPVFSYNDVGNELHLHTMDELSSWGKRKGVYLNDAFIALRKDGGNHIDKPYHRKRYNLVINKSDCLVSALVEGYRQINK